MGRPLWGTHSPHKSDQLSVGRQPEPRMVRAKSSSSKWHESCCSLASFSRIYRIKCWPRQSSTTLTGSWAMDSVPCWTHVLIQLRQYSKCRTQVWLLGRLSVEAVRGQGLSNSFTWQFLIEMQSCQDMWVLMKKMNKQTNKKPSCLEVPLRDGKTPSRSTWPDATVTGI